MSKNGFSRLPVRLLLLAAALFFVIGGPLPLWIKRGIPALSPLTWFTESIAQRGWYTGLFWGLPPLAVLALAVWKGRFFCRRICPLGTLYWLPGKIRGSVSNGGNPASGRRVLTVRLNAAVFWIVVASSVLGMPVLLFLDPLSTFGRLGAWREAAAWVPGLLIPLFLLLSCFQPQVWCAHLCPLGYCFDLLHVKSGRRVFQRDRRQFLAGIGIGLPGALVLSRLVKRTGRKAVLPPGATGQFAETCTRCYACVSVCPPRIIHIKPRGALHELFMPELRFDCGACEESCNRCSQVCPSGAIRRLSDDAKWRRQIGVARVEKDKCLAWADRQYCMVCDEYCPYNAIDTHWEGDIACPVVNPDLCRGCGACENACPALRAGKAILVHALDPQKSVRV